MTTECEYNKRTGEEATLHDCEKCQEEYELPFSHCCLNGCGEHEFCRNCENGIYKQD